jgi:hypothetical protein
MYVNSNLMFVKSFLSGFVAIVGVCYPEPIKSVDAGAGGTMPVYLFIHILIFQILDWKMTFGAYWNKRHL